MIELKLELKQKAKNARGEVPVGGGGLPRAGICPKGCLPQGVSAQGRCLSRGVFA